MERPAAARVVNTVELLETILLKLPTRTLLLSQRISKQWQLTIKGSQKLQQALFFKPIEGGPLRCYTTSGDWCVWYLDSDPDGAARTIVKNSLLDPLIGDAFYLDQRSPLAVLPEPWRRADASWRLMLPSQPSAHLEFSIFTSIGGIEQLEPDKACMFGTDISRMGEIRGKIDDVYGEASYEGVLKAFTRGDDDWKCCETGEETLRRVREVETKEESDGEDPDGDE